MSKDHQEKDKGKKGKRGEDRKKYDERKIIKKIKKKKWKGLFLRILPRRNSFERIPLGGIRLMTSPCIRARQELSKNWTE